MNKLYIWFNRTVLPKGYPIFGDYIFKSQFDIKNPKKVYDENWKRYSYLKMAYSLKEDIKFPAEMYLIVIKKKYKSIFFDYYNIGDHVRLVSEDFMLFLKENGLEESYYEIALLNVLNIEGESLVDKKFYALRFRKHDDNLFDFHFETKKRAAGIRDSFLYPDMEIQNEVYNKNIFSLYEFCYNDTLILNEKGKIDVLTNFYAPQIYQAKDFPYIFNNQYKWDILPFDNKYNINYINDENWNWK
jgi:hypothetical protein